MGAPPNDPTRTDRQERGVAAARARRALDGALLRVLFADACELLRRHVRALNAINVFPVPDGDTGTNMHLTLRAGVDELSATNGTDLSGSARALALGSLMGARGNSGVILSQILRGCHVALNGRPDADGPALAAALSSAAEAAHDALSEPVEGTILTVMREAAQAVAEDPPPTIEETLSRAAEAAKDAVERTPDLLPVLKEAGVVDAGGLGLSIILEGLLRSLRDESLDVNLAPDSAVEAGWRSEAASLHQSEDGQSGYCTEFMISGRGLRATDAREHLSSLGSSLLVVGGEDLLRVHVHTIRPDDAIAYGRTLGSLSQVKVDNLEAQIQRFVSDEPPPPPVTESIGVVVVAAGDGIEAAFRSVGVPNLVRGGQTMNPSAAEILAAIEACPAEHVLVLPNNKNVIAAAQQAAERASKQARVVPSRSIPQGVAAVLALNPDLPFEATIEAMERALASVRSAEVTRAVRATVVDGRHIQMGQAIGIIEGSLRVVAEDIAAAAEACADEMLSPETSLLTLYAGEDVRHEEAVALADKMRSRYPDLEIELVRGDQPHYPYILSLE